MDIQKHIEAIENFKSDGSEECFARLKEHMVAVSPEYLLNQDPDKNALNNAFLNQNNPEAKMKLLQVAVECRWPIFDPNYNFAYHFAFYSKWFPQPGTIRLFEYLLDMGLDSHATSGDSDDMDTITDELGIEISYEICCEGGPLKEIQYLAAAWNMLRAHQKKLPYRGFENFETAISRRLTAVYARKADESTKKKELEPLGQYSWSYVLPNELVFDFEGKLLVYDGDVYVNPHVLTNEPQDWVEISQSLQNFIGLKLIDLDFEELREKTAEHSTACRIASIFKFESNEYLTGIRDDKLVLLEDCPFETILPKLKGIRHQPRCKSWDGVVSNEMEEILEGEEIEEVDINLSN